MTDIDNLFKKEFDDGRGFSFAWRIFLDEFYRRESSGQQSLIADRPTVLEGKDLSFLAATVHKLAMDYELEVPTWCVDRSLVLKEPMFSTTNDKLRLLCLVESPVQFKLKNIFTVENVLSRT